MIESGMLLATLAYPNEGRKLKGFIMGLVKGRIASCVQRINYVKSYYMREGEFTRREEKILLIKLPAPQKDRLLSYVQKNHPYKVPELLFIKPDEVEQSYLNRVLGGPKD